MSYRILYTNGIILELSEVTNRRKMWRTISKDCKIFSARVVSITKF